MRVWQRTHTGVYAEAADPEAARVSHHVAPADSCNSCKLAEQIPPLYRGATLADLPEGLVRVYQELPEHKGLYLWGLPGRGKTHSMAAFAVDRWCRGYDIVRVTYESLMLTIRDTFKPGAKVSEADAIKQYNEADVLFLEDVGTTASDRESDFSMRTFFVLLDNRLEQMRPTFVTSNRTVGQLGDSFNGRIESRLLAACQSVCLTGEDWREQR